MVEECGAKCANPGCHTRRVEIHHIRKWAIWATNDEKHLIALCPTCHDAAHHGKLPLDDAMLYQWKSLLRSLPTRDVLQIETGTEALLFMGSSTVCSQGGIANVVDFAEDVRLQFRVDGDEFFLLNLSLTTVAGARLISIADNRIVHSPASFITYESRPGRVRLVTSSVKDCIPDWLPEQVAKFDKAHAWEGLPSETDLFRSPLTLLDMEVVAPSQVRIRGAFCTARCALFIPEDQIYVATPGCCSAVSGFARFILRGEKDVFCASPERESYYGKKGGGGFLTPNF